MPKRDTSAKAGKLDEALAIRDAAEQIKERLGGALPDPGNLTAFRDHIGETMRFCVTGRTTGSVWGTGLYTDDSDLGTVAVHAGFLKPGQVGVVQVTIRMGEDHYDGVTLHGVSSADYGLWDGSYTVQSADTPSHQAKKAELTPEANDRLQALNAALQMPDGGVQVHDALTRIGKLQDRYTRAVKLDEAVALRDTAHKQMADFYGVLPKTDLLSAYRGQFGRVLCLEVTARTSGSVWGSGIYTDDSDPAAAAVHAGVLKTGQHGLVWVRLLPGSQSYQGSAQHEVTSGPYGAWTGSFGFVGALAL